MSESLSQWLEPIAAWFRSMNLPEPIVHWGHPLMMGIVVVAMGSAVGWTGWRGRLAGGEVATKNWGEHRKIAPLMFLFIAMGYTGGVLSLVMQQKPILESPHFITGTAAIVLLSVNGALIALSGGQNKTLLRTAHAYLGGIALCLLVLHGVLGLQLGLSI